MPKPSQQHLQSVRADFLSASDKWPGLHHAFLQLDGKTGKSDQLDWSKVGESNFFLESWTRAVVAPIVGKRVILEIISSIYDTVASDRLSNTAYFDDPPGNLSGLRQFKELAVTASRCFFPEVAAQWSNAYGHNTFLPDAWLGQVYTLALEHRDPLLIVREHRLEISDDGDKILLAPGYSIPIPNGNVSGMAGRCRPWKDLLTDLERLGVYVDVLESGVFRASAYVLEQLIGKRWRIGGATGKRGRGRKKSPRVTGRDKAIVKEYKRNPNQERKAIAVKVALSFRDVACGTEQVRKAIAEHKKTLGNATGKK